MADIIHIELDEDLVFLFVPPKHEKLKDLIENVITDTLLLSEVSLKHKQRCIKEN